MQRFKDLKYSNSVRESFSPNYIESAYRVGFHNGLYESMHHFDGYGFIDEILDNVKSIAKSIKGNNVSVCINYDYLCDDYADIVDAGINFTAKKLVNKITNSDWCRQISFAGLLVIADDIETAKKIYSYATIGIMPSAVCLTNFYLNYCAINCMCIGYVDGELVNLYDDASLKEMIYHEMMHAYSTFISGDKKRRYPSNDFMINGIAKLHGQDEDDKYVNGLYSICQLIYNFSEHEFASIVAQHHIAFQGIKSKKDFYSKLNNCRGMEVIKTANDCIDFLESIKGYDYKVSHLLFLYLNEKSENHTTEWFISHAIDKIHADVDKFKHCLYNVAYDACSTNLQNEIDDDYIRCSR